MNRPAASVSTAGAFGADPGSHYQDDARDCAGSRHLAQHGQPD
jgi:hypothetical protein